MPNKMTAGEAAEILKVLEKVSFCDAAHEAYACHYSETGCSGCEWQNAKNKIQNILRCIESGEVREVIHAHWIDTGFYGQHHEPILECSSCHDEIEELKLRKAMRRCPTCAALMDGKDDSHE